MNDAKLIGALRRGQRGALDKVIAKYSGYAASVARSVLGNAATREDMEEIVSDALSPCGVRRRGWTKPARSKGILRRLPATQRSTVCAASARKTRCPRTMS